ncbi:MAG: hypothetical protein QOG01_3123 [Pseudonocardiales bacterium]|jgi:hypothetical protein|nr:hypothetical protein [Pseudonocardiales bacterium]
MPQREERALAFPDGFARSVGPFGAPNVSSALSGALAAMIAIDGYADATGDALLVLMDQRTSYKRAARRQGCDERPI